MSPNQFADRIIAARKRISVPIGVHTHNNIGLGVGNAIAGVEAGATYVDGATEGLGAGSGNGNTAAIVVVLDKMGYHTGCDWYIGQMARKMCGLWCGTRWKSRGQHHPERQASIPASCCMSNLPKNT